MLIVNLMSILVSITCMEGVRSNHYTTIRSTLSVK